MTLSLQGTLFVFWAGALKVNSFRHATVCWVHVTAGSGAGGSTNGVSANSVQIWRRHTAVLMQVKEGSIAATIDEATGMVRFQDDQEVCVDINAALRHNTLTTQTLANARVLARLEVAMANTVVLGQQIRDIESKLLTNAAYIAKVQEHELVITNNYHCSPPSVVARRIPRDDFRRGALACGRHRHG
jgi:hypothetical protein